MFRRPPAGTTGANVHLFLLRETVTLVYYPIWDLRYRYKGRRYQMTVDARSGVVHSARAPADHTRRLIAFLASAVALAMLLGAVVSIWQAWAAGREMTVYAGVAILFAALGVCWRFRLVREVRYDEPFSS